MVLWARLEINGSALEVLTETTKSKPQITNKSQIPILNDPNLPGRDVVYIFEFWSLRFV
jgi:hypothetical protein